MKPLNAALKDKLAQVALAIRSLSIDAVEKADSGHPGLPMGCAEIGAYLYGHFLRLDPKHPEWLGRDRFILSAGHGSMLLYSCLHLSGFDLSLDDLKKFRQLHSKTPGHPERGETPGVETTSGPLGQGVGNAVGQALALKMSAAKLASEEFNPFNAKVVTLMGDGCMMEGTSSEVSSFAGHMQLDNLILIYDANEICLDGPISECFSEDVKKRYQAYGFDVFAIDGHSFDELDAVLSHLRTEQKKPALIVAKTVIGRGSPNKAGTSKVHGSPLGKEETALTKSLLGLPVTEFWIPEEATQFFKERQKEWKGDVADWNSAFSDWKKENPDSAKLLEMRSDSQPSKELIQKLAALEIKSPIAGRKASQEALQLLASELPGLVGGSADLSCSDLTMLKEFGIVSKNDFSKRNIKFGVREFGMATIASGIAETTLFTPFIGTFLTFSDYMRNAIRLAALMRLKVIYQFTHDSIFLGEDGPTHQPIEHIASLRAIPFLQVIRPADAREVKGAWAAALHYEGPTALILSRQNLPELQGTDQPYTEGVAKGAYFLGSPLPEADYTIIATGSEVALALECKTLLTSKGKSVNVISMPCQELFDLQPLSYQRKLLDSGKKIISIEAGVAQGWHRFADLPISIETFGASAPIKALKEAYGFTPEAIVKKVEEYFA